MKNLIFTIVGIFLFAVSPIFAQKINYDILSKWSWQKLPEAMDELDETLRIPNNALVASDVSNTVNWTTKSFEKRGFSVEVLTTDGPPLLLAERKIKKSKATVLFYLHLDGQAVDSSKWDQESPYIPVIKKQLDGKWHAVNEDELAKGYNDEWRIFARSSSDDTGPVVMFLAAIDLIDAHKIKPNYNIKMIMDLEEENGSPNLPRAVTKFADKLNADQLVIFDGPRHISNKPTLSFGARGIATLSLTVFGPRNPLHSGHYGNYAPNPALRLSKLLASMKDNNGKVIIKGYYDGISLTDSDRQEMGMVPDDEADIQQKIGIGEADKVGNNYQESLQYPSLNIRGLGSGWIGDESRTIVPATATTEIDIRLVPESDGPRLIELVRQHVLAQGFYIIDGISPTEAERSQYGKMVSFTSVYSYPAFRTPINSTIGNWLSKSLYNAFGEDPIKIRIMGGSIPISPFVSTLNTPAVVVPVVNPDNNQHSPNENLRIGNFREGIMAFTAILATPLK
ncbi:MAG: acetylornithine deacetylase [Bacteroidetes bacterium]|nr:MAG: acetylornithine deacetylase [Bacteroidota bacterium]